MEFKLTNSILERIERQKGKRNKRDFLKEEFEMSVFSKLDNSYSAPCLRYDGRIFRDYYNIPLDAIKKTIRGADENWEDCTIENGVLVNHNADLVFHSKEKEMMSSIFTGERPYIDIYYGKNGRYKIREYDLVTMGYSTYKELPNIDTKTF